MQAMAVSPLNVPGFVSPALPEPLWRMLCESASLPALPRLWQLLETSFGELWSQI